MTSCPRSCRRTRGKFVVIDIDTGAYEVDADELAASDRLLARYPDAQVWLRQVGSRVGSRVAMVTGEVNAYREAIVRLTVQ